MSNQIQYKFDKANKAFEEGNILEFSNGLVDFYEEVTCWCFFREQDNNIFIKQLKSIELIEDDTSSFSLNLTKGHLYLHNKNYEEAYFYLTRAIEINNLSDLAFFLRSITGIDVNPTRQEDKMNAIRLKPSAKAYFFLSRSLGYEKDSNLLKESLDYISKAIEIKSDFGCAYNVRSKILAKSANYKEAIEDLIKYIEFEEDHHAYARLCSLLDKEKRYKEVLKYAHLGAKEYAEDSFYLLILAFTYNQINEFEESIKYSKEYLDRNPRDLIVDMPIRGSYLNEALERNKESMRDKYLSKAIKYYNDRSYDQAVINFDSFLAIGGSLAGGLSDYDKTDLYLIAQIKKEKDVNIGVENKIYKKLDSLKFSYRIKMKKKLDLLEDEKNISKLMKYRSSDEITFGIYKGEDIGTIIAKDPQYILWCIINLTHFSIHNTLFFNEKLKSEPEYLNALEHNLIKEMIIHKYIYEDESDNTSRNTSSYAEYGGAYGYDDDTIDGLFDGDPDNYWNID